MTLDNPPNGKGITVTEWVRDILAFLIKLIESNDKRYEERWKAQEQAILKQESAQAQYNLQHNGLLADNRKQTEETNRKFETVIGKDDAAIRFSALLDRMNKAESLLEQRAVPIAQIKPISDRVAALEAQSLIEKGERGQRVETKTDTRFTVNQIVTIAFGIIGVVFGVIGIIERLR